MATTEAEASSSDRIPSPGSVYDGFISYSHAADDLLAPRLQAGLQKFAKPWWKRRALRLFRDEASLSANPHLWSSITEALDQSGWFVLLLSPDAAESPWVNREVEFWLAHKDAERIIPVLTDGEIEWQDGDIVSDAAPPALHGAFSGEPRWVDLRFARSEEQLDLKNPQFSAAVADVASALRGVPKDELESEEVKQHRRTIRTAWAAGIVVTALAVLAVGTAIFAVGQQNEAIRQAEVAQAERDRAVAAEEAAVAAADAEEQQRLLAEEQQAAAELSADLAFSNELALRAEKEIAVDPERAVLLALEAVRISREAGVEPVEAVQVLRTALGSSRVVQRLPGGVFVSVAADGSMLATSSGTGVAVWDTTEWELVKTFEREDATAANAAFSSDGEKLAVVYDSVSPPVIVYDLATDAETPLVGKPLSTRLGADIAFAARGELVAASRALDGVGVWSATTGALSYELEGWPLAVDPAGESLAVLDGDRLRIHDISTGDVLLDVGGSETNSCVSFSPDGGRLAETSQGLTRLLIRDAGTGQVLLDAQVDRLVCATWIDDSRVAVGGEGAQRVVDTETGDVLFELAGHTSPVFSLHAIPGTELVATAGIADGTVLIWDVSEAGLTELPPIDTQLPTLWMFFPGPDGSLVLQSDPASESGESGQSAWVLPDGGTAPQKIAGELIDLPAWNQDGSLIAFTRIDGSSGVMSIPNGDVIYEAPTGLQARGVNLDGSLVVLQETNFPARGTEQALVVETASRREIGRVDPSEWFMFSPDSTLVFPLCCGSLGQGSVYLLPGGEPTGDYDTFINRISDDGSILAFSPNITGDIWLLDTEQLKAERDIEAARVAEIRAHSNLVIALDFSPDGNLLVTGTFDEPLKVWDVAGVLAGREPELIATIDAEPRRGPSTAYFRPNGRHIVSMSIDGLLRVFTANTDELIEIAELRLTRGLTEDECQTYLHQSCPQS